MNSRIHPLAQIHPQACIGDVSIGARTRVWQFASIIRGAKLGEDCNVASGACLDGSVAGDRCIIGHNLAAGPGFLIGDDVFIGPNVTLCNDAWPRTEKHGFDPAVFDQAYKWAIIIENGASIGANSVVLPGVRIGARAMIGAGSVVTHDVPPLALWLGRAPAGQVRSGPTRMRFADQPRERAERLAGEHYGARRQLGLGSQQ